MIRPWRDWDRFWFRPQTARALGLFRIAVGLITLYAFALYAKDAAAFFSDAGVLRVETLDRHAGRDYVSVLRWLRTPAGVAAALAALFAAGTLFTLGLWTRASAIVLFLLVLSFQERNPLVRNGSDTVLRCMLFYFMFAPAGAAFSLDARRRKGKGAVLVAPWAQRMMQLQVSVIYLVSAYAKCGGDLYRNGTAMYYVFGLLDFHVRGVERLMDWPVVCSFLTYGTLLGEAALAFLLWFRRARPYAVLVGVLLHGWIMVAMTLPVFGVLMLACYIPFLGETEVNRLRVLARRLRPAAPLPEAGGPGPR